MRDISAPERLEPDVRCTGLAALLLAASAVWVALVWWAPIAIASPTASGIRHVVPLASYVAGSAVCHQRHERSFAVAGVRQPVCARCSGLYLGAPIGIACALALARRGGRRRPAPVSLRTARRVVAWAAAPTLASVVVEWLQIGLPGNGIRFLLAVPPGAAVGWLTAAALLGRVGERVE
jgi:hypothetical protein